ncbi:glucosaminidase domain-containing protein [Polaromonas sp.]|uniref:glucosaminidase domain-containing protein n=1 Tax=Polaromonas sp. TaxID=1869339 RepID=UPI003529E33E
MPIDTKAVIWDAPAKRSSNPTEFADVYGLVAQRIGKQLNVDPNIVLGQLGLETRWGKSIIPGTNNLGNIKDFSGAGVGATDNMTGSRDKYRAYESPDAFADDFVSLIQRKYPDAIGAKDAQSFASALKAGGYAEDPRYVDKVVQATRMSTERPGKFAAAVGKAVGSLIPSAHAGTRVDPAQVRWDTDEAPKPPRNPSNNPSGPEMLGGAARPAPMQAAQAIDPKQVIWDTQEPAKPSLGERAYRGALKALPGGFVLDMLSQGNPVKDAANTLGGAVRGAGSIGATLLAPVDMASDAMDGKGLSLESNRARRAAMDGGLRELGVDTGSGAYQVGKLGAEIAGTAGVGNVFGLGAKAVGAAPRVVNALVSGGMNVGQGGGAVGNALLRLGAGGAVGGTSAGMINPEDAAWGAGIGASAPFVAAGARGVTKAVGGAIRNLTTSPGEKAAARLAEYAGMAPEEMAGALRQQGPQMIPGYEPTVPQILQTPEMAQLQRTVKTAGGTALGNAERVQQGQYREAMERIAPIDASVQDAAQRAGSAIQGYAVPAREVATKNVRNAFGSVDPFNEARLMLPLEEMQAAQAQYLGAGTFGTGGKAQAALAEARRVGTEAAPALTAAAAPGSRSQPQDIAQAIRRLGGINSGAVSSRGMAGELADLRQSGLGSVMQNGRGQSLDTLAQAMHAQGFIADAEPTTLLNALRDQASGSRIVSIGADQSRGMRAGIEAAMGEAPAATAIPKAVPFQTVQNLRSSIGEAAEQASAKGANKEAAALRQMIADIDTKIQATASGKGGAGEFFPQDIAEQYRAALNAHADKMQRFETGPQAGMFRKGGDGMPSVQGAEVPGKFFSGRRSQADDMQAFKRLVGNRDDLMAEMKRYAVTEGASTSNVAGDLTSKFLKWMETRSGANRELFNPGELATLKEVGKAVERSIAAESLGRVSGSDTAQKLAALQSTGLLDNRLVDFAGSRIPLVRSFSGPVLNNLRDSTRRTQNALLDRYLSNPGELADILSKSALRNGGQNRLADYLSTGLRAAPAAYAD